MKNFKNSVIAGAVFAGLSLVGILMNSHRATAQGPDGGVAVRIVSPSPVPVSGAVTISGTPTVTLGTPVPLPVTPAISQPIQVSGGGSLTGPGANFNLYVVPAGKRLIVEHFSPEAGMDSTTTVNRYLLSIADPAHPGVSVFGQFIQPAFSSPCGTCVPNQVLVIAGQPIRMYLEAGQTLIAYITFSGPVGTNGFAFFAITGYLVNAT